MRSFDPDRFVEQAVEATGVDDFGVPGWREGLDRLTDALDGEAALSELGVAVAQGEIGQYLRNRLGVIAARRAEPEIARSTVQAPVVIVGQARTGTTILFDVLAQDPRNRVPRSWEVAAPCPAPETATYETDERIEAVDAQLAAIDLVLPEFRRMHPMGARLAQECVAFTVAHFASMQFPTQYRVPSYARWLLHEADMAGTYRWHRTFLQHLQSRHPAPRWVLKSPGHIWCLDALLAEYPDALLVQTHRDPVRIIASLGSLVSTLRSLTSDAGSVAEAAAEFADHVIEGLDRSVDARLDGTVAARQVIDVQFADFMRDPMHTIAAVYEHLGQELTAEVYRRMQDFLRSNPQDKHGGHEYSLAATGLDVGALRERCRRYQEFFGVPDEPVA